jgi:type IV pilus assembly protein PilW
MNAAHRKPAVRAIRSRGFTLIELMIALTIGLILVGGLFSMFVSSSANLSELKKSAEHLENGSMATRILNLDLAHAGYYGEYYALPAPGAALPDPCALTAAALYAALAYPVQGYDAPATSPLTCLGNNDFVPGTDILVVRAAEPAVLAATDIPVANEVYLQGISTTAEVQFGAGAAPIGTTNKADGTATDLFLKDGVSAASIRKLEVHIYFIAPCSMPSDGGDSCTGAGDDGGRPIPTLKRLELTSVGGITGWRRHRESAGAIRRR